MKFKFLFSLFIIAMVFASNSFSQSSFKKRYFVPEKVSDPKDDKARTSYFYKGNFDPDKGKSKDTVRYTFDSAGYYTKCGAFFYYTGKKKTGKVKYIEASVKHSGKHLLINPWLNHDVSYRDSSFAFIMKNRESIRLSYRQWTITPVTVPIKVQFGKDNRTNFSSGISLGGMVGYSFGRTRFTYRKNLDNFERSHEFTLGLAFNFEGIEIERENKALDDVETASTSVGLGFIYSYDKINFGLVGGIEFAHGFAASQWDFNNRPWAGILIGYSIFD